MRSLLGGGAGGGGGAGARGARSRGDIPGFRVVWHGVSAMVGKYKTASSASSTLVTLPSTASGAWSVERTEIL